MIFNLLDYNKIHKKQNTDYLTLYKQRLCKYYKVYEDYTKFDMKQAENTKSAKR